MDTGNIGNNMGNTEMIKYEDHYVTRLGWDTSQLGFFGKHVNSSHFGNIFGFYKEKAIELMETVLLPGKILIIDRPFAYWAGTGISPFKFYSEDIDKSEFNIPFPYILQIRQTSIHEYDGGAYEVAINDEKGYSFSLTALIQYDCISDQVLKVKEINLLENL